MGQVEWLEDSQCFMATSDDIDGLVLQADNLAEMEEEMQDIIPVLLESNHGVSIDAESMTLEPARQIGAGHNIHDQPPGLSLSLSMWQACREVSKLLRRHGARSSANNVSSGTAPSRAEFCPHGGVKTRRFT